MRNKFYDEWRFNIILKKVESDPRQAKVLFENYFNDFPKDYSAYSFYASCLITLGLYDEASIVLDSLDDAYKNDNKFFISNNSEKINFLNCNIIYAKLRLLCRQKKYKDALELYYSKYEYTKNMDLERIALYCKIKLNLLENDERKKYFYLIRQAIEYQTSDFLYHVKKHVDEDTVDDDEKLSVFKNNFPIEKIVSEIDKYLMSDNGVLYGFGFIEDLYYFKYDDCGLSKGKKADYFKVVTFHDTKNIITMFPVVNHKNLPYTDLNYMNVEDKPMVKVLSQSDKFIKRYGIK